jgi:hypothetical protein
MGHAKTISVTFRDDGRERTHVIPTVLKGKKRTNKVAIKMAKKQKILGHGFPSVEMAEEFGRLRSSLGHQPRRKERVRTFTQSEILRDAERLHRQRLHKYKKK